MVTLLQGLLTAGPRVINSLWRRSLYFSEESSENQAPLSLSLSNQKFISCYFNVFFFTDRDSEHKRTAG